MMVSTKGRYALRVMIDLAENCNGGYIPMREVAKRQDISLKYLERILPALVGARLVEGIHGKGGGYCLTREPSGYTVGEILRATEGDIAPVACVECDAQSCGREDRCRTLPMWKEYDQLTRDFFYGKKLSDLSEGDI
jgi:Rrf2 family protein